MSPSSVRVYRVMASAVRRAFRWVLLVLGSILFVGLCRSLGLSELREALAAASPARLLAFVLLSSAVFTVYAIRWRCVLAADSDPPDISIVRLLGFRAAGHAVSFLLPSAHGSGEALRVWLLRRRDLDWTSATFAVAADRIVEMSVASVLGPFYVLIFFVTTGAPIQTGRWLLVGMAAGLVGLGSLYMLALRGKGTLSAFFRRRFTSVLGAPVAEIERRFSEFVRSRRFLAALLLSFAAEALIVAEIWTLTRAFHVSLPLPTILAVLVGMGISHLAPVPGALGTLEATQVGALMLAGGSAELGLAVGLLVRLRETIWTLVGLGCLLVPAGRNTVT